jgi:excisionase family DNA binding protein
MTRQIPIVFLSEPLAVRPAEAAKLLACSPSTIYRMKKTGDLKTTKYGTIPVAELQRHLQNEMRKAA